MSSRRVTERTVLLAPAKLTLSLAITGVRGDGMHLIDAEMVTVDLYDELTLAPPTGGSSEGEITVEFAPNVAGDADAITGSDGLVRRALKLADIAADVHVAKRIGVGAGLGGGSADAAALLRFANAKGWAEPPFESTQAAQLGADVGFCLVGGRARVTGVGETVQPLGASHEPFTLLTPPLHVPTAAVYAAWDVLGSAGAAGSGSLGNDLEAAALAVEPQLAEWRDALGSQTGETPQLAGSGGTFFVRGRYPDVSHSGVAAQVVSTAGPTAAWWSQAN